MHAAPWQGVGGFDFRRPTVPYQDRPIPIAHARTAGEQRITLTHIWVGVNGDGRNVQLAPKRAFIQRLNIFQSVLESITAKIDLVFSDRIKHEGIIWIR